MYRKSRGHTSTTSSKVCKLNSTELMTVDGGRSPITVFRHETPTRKYVKGTPGWAIAGAIFAGYEIERLD